MARDRTPIYVEYHEGRPFDVITASGDQYDFEYCKRDGLIYYILSGAGSAPTTGFRAPKFYRPEKTVRTTKIWVAPGLRLTDGRGRTVRKHESRGYRLLARLPGDPFKRPDVCEGSVVRCDTCDDYLPDDTDHPCAHVWWCDACHGWGGEAGTIATCKHETAEAARAAEDEE